MQQRIDDLQHLLRYDRSLVQINEMLKKFPWDSKIDLVILENHHIISVLQRYLSKETTASEVEEWANLIESREDVGFEGETLEVIFELANPELAGQLNREAAQRLLERLG